MEIIVLRRACRVCDTAREYGVEERALMELNGIERRGILPEGMSLVLPRGEGRAAEKKELYYTWSKGASRTVGSASFLAEEFAPDDAEDCENILDTAAGSGALPVYSITARGDLQEMRSLICDKDRSAAFFETLTGRLADMGYGALGLNISRLLPFDREHFTAFAAQTAEAAHRRGLWFICTLPLYSERERHQRPFAAYDAAALGQVADRLILDSGTLMASGDMEEGIEYVCSLVPGGRLLPETREGARISRGGEIEWVFTRCAQNLAAALGAKIARRGKGGLAEFSYEDPAGERCRVEYGDALWAVEICALVEKYSLAGLAGRRGQGSGGGAERVLERYFSPQELI